MLYMLKYKIDYFIKHLRIKNSNVHKFARIAHLSSK